MGAVLDFYQEYQNDVLDRYKLPDEITARYDVKACLKMSATKQVYLITSKTNWKKYVLKAVPNQCQENLEEEYELYKTLSHPGIIVAHEFIKCKENQYLIRDYIEGDTITEMVEMTEEGHLSEEMLLDIMLQLCEILHYLHSLTPPIIHRDITPDNIIITKQRKCILIDFGIAKHYNSNKKADTVVMGTPLSSPPEQYGFRQTDTRSDIYSIGILMFYMATGNLDIRDKNQYHLPYRINKIIERCTKFSPKERYASVKHLRIQLLHASQKRKSTFYLVAGIAVLLFVFAGGLFLVQNPRNIDANNDNPIDVQSLEQASANTQQDKVSEIMPEIKAQEEEELTDRESYPSNHTKRSMPLNASSGSKATEKQSDEAQSEAGATDVLNTETEVTNPERTETEATGTDATEINEKKTKTTQNTGKDVTEKQEPLSPDPSMRPQTKEDATDQTTSVIDSPAASSQENEPYKFQSALIEKAVRDQLGGVSSKIPVTYGDLKRITSLFLCGEQSYSNWDEHFVYGVSQYMLGSDYNDTGLFMRNGGITTLEDISHMTNLEQLALYNQKISDLTPLTKLPYLTRLGVGSNNIDNLEPILSMDCLGYLDISANPIMNNDITQLSVLKNLWGLDLGATKVTSIYGIRNMPLCYLSLFECKMGDCIGLEEMTGLDNLIITGVNNAITEKAIDRISKLTKLRILKIFGSGEFDLAKLSTLKSLYLLDLCGMWAETDLSRLDNPTIEQLYISYLKNLKLTGVEKLSNITMISMTDSVCSDYTPLLKVRNLKQVYCNQNQAREIREQLGSLTFELVE